MNAPAKLAPYDTCLSDTHPWSGRVTVIDRLHEHAFVHNTCIRYNFPGDRKEKEKVITLTELLFSSLLDITSLFFAPLPAT